MIPLKISEISKSTETEKQMSGCQSWTEEEMGSDCNRYGVSFENDECVIELDSGGGFKTW